MSKVVILEQKRQIPAELTIDSTMTLGLLLTWGLTWFLVSLVKIKTRSNWMPDKKNIMLTLFMSEQKVLDFPKNRKNGANSDKTKVTTKATYSKMRWQFSFPTVFWN